MSDQLRAILIGAGSRGMVYSSYALLNPNELIFVGIAEPNDKRRNNFIAKHPYAAKNAYLSWEDLLDLPQFADIAFICTQDTMHTVPATKAMAKGYDVLLEKPVAVTPEECVQLARMAKDCGISSAVGHVLRYAPFFRQIKETLQSRTIGSVLSIQHNENVGHIHYAHSYVRGAWSKTSSSSPMILSKSCHDMDILQWLLDLPCHRVSSFGSLSFFRPENAPSSAPKFCLHGCKHQNTCPYYAPKIYLEGGHWVASNIGIEDCTASERLELLRTIPYGRCVFQSDNDVMDHQVVNLEFERGVTASFTMCGLTHETSRTIKIMGTSGEIRGDLEKNEIIVYQFSDGSRNTIQLPILQSTAGHGGGDLRLVQDFLAHCRNKSAIPENSSLEASVSSHLMSFAAEKSRLEKRTIDFKNYQSSIEGV